MSKRSEWKAPKLNSKSVENVDENEHTLVRKKLAVVYFGMKADVFQLFLAVFDCFSIENRLYISWDCISRLSVLRYEKCVKLIENLRANLPSCDQEDSIFQ